VSQNDQSAKPQRFQWFRWIFWPVFVVVFLLIFGAVYLRTTHKYAVSQLTNATAAIDQRDPFWQLQEIEMARAEVPDEENSAVVVQAAANLLPQNWPPQEVNSLTDRTHAPNEPLDPKSWGPLRDALDAAKPAVQEARKLANLPRGRFTITYHTNPFLTLIPHVQWARNVTNLLILDALRSMEEGNYLQAARSCRAAVNAGRSLGDEPFAVSQLVRTAIVHIACGAVERLLAHGEVDDRELAELQQLLENEATFPRLLVSCRGERAMMHATLTAMENGDAALDMERPRTVTSWKERWQTYLARDGLRLQHARAVPLMNKLVEIAETPAPLRQQTLQEYQALAAAHRKEMPTILAPAVDKLEKAFSRLDATLFCLDAAIAVERYRCRNKKWPATLAELTPVYLTGVPLDPFDEQPLRYVQVADGIVVYSLCPGGDGKVFDPNKPSSREGLVVRLWNVEQRGKKD
jgi:hypothetical protein